MTVNKTGSAMTSKTQTGAAAAGNTSGMRQYVSPPMAAQTISAGTAKGTIRVLESAANDNIDNISLQLRVVDALGTTFNGTSIMALNTYVPVNEFGTVLTARRLCDGDATTSVTVNVGDRLVLDLAYRTSAGGTTLSSSFSFGDNSATDLGDNETDTAANNPFIELSVDIAWFVDKIRVPGLYPPVLAQ